MLASRQVKLCAENTALLNQMTNLIPVKHQMSHVQESSDFLWNLFSKIRKLLPSLKFSLITEVS